MDGAWRKSSHSHANGSCVEVCTDSAGNVYVRNSEDARQGELIFSPDSWKAFIAGARGGEFDLADD